MKITDKEKARIDANVEALALRRQGKSAADISRHFAAKGVTFSRSAVIGMNLRQETMHATDSRDPAICAAIDAGEPFTLIARRFEVRIGDVEALAREIAR